MNFYEFYNLINEYGRNTVEFLVQKFQQEQPGLNRNIIELYIKDFDKIKNKLQNKDITKYSWKELETAVDSNRPKPKIKAGTLDPTVTDSNLIYNQDKIRVYLGKDRKSCIKYSNGYTFCIGARGEGSMYDRYRVDNKGTPYFIFNDNLPKTDNKHLIVLFVYKNEPVIHNASDSWSQPIYSYTVTKADNRGDKEYKNIEDIIKDYPWIKNFENTIQAVDPEVRETIEHKLIQEYYALKNFYFYQSNLTSDDVSWKPTTKFKRNPNLYLSFKNMVKNNLNRIDEILERKKIAHINVFVLTNWDEQPDTDDPWANFEKPVEKIEDSNGTSHIIEAIMPYDDASEIVRSIVQDINHQNIEMEIKNIEKIKTELIKNTNEVKRILDNNKDFATEDIDIIDIKQITLPQNTILLPYMIISLGSPTEYVKEELRINSNNIKKILEFDNKYKKQINWVKQLATEKQLKNILQPIMDAYRASFDYLSGRIRKIIERQMQ